MHWQWEWTCTEAQRVYGTYAAIKGLKDKKYKFGRDLHTCRQCFAKQEKIPEEEAIPLIKQKRTQQMQGRATQYKKYLEDFLEFLYVGRPSDKEEESDDSDELVDKKNESVAKPPMPSKKQMKKKWRGNIF